MGLDAFFTIIGVQNVVDDLICLYFVKQFGGILSQDEKKINNLE
jgi:hypothetical protein